MKKSNLKKSSTSHTNSTASTVAPLHPTTQMSVATALTHFDFSVFPPQPKSTQGELGDSVVHLIGIKLQDGIATAFVQHDTPTFVQCYTALHYCMGLDMESHRLNFGPHGKVAFLMTAYQAAVLFNHADMVTGLFEACLASPHYPIRAGISTPLTMITHAYSTGMQPGSPQDEAAWMTIIDDMIAALVDRLEVVGPDDLCPTTGMVFQVCNTAKSKHDRDALTRLCKAMSDRYTQLVEQSSNTPPASTNTTTNVPRL